MDLTLVFLGLLLAFIIDIYWWNQTKFKKLDAKMAAHEHYHIGIELAIVAVIVNVFFEPMATFLGAAAVGFLVAEWKQSVEIHKKHVIPGHPFAFGSKHFKESTIIGAILVAVLIGLSFYINFI